MLWLILSLLTAVAVASQDVHQAPERAHRNPVRGRLVQGDIPIRFAGALMMLSGSFLIMFKGR
jgi:hypothetical protein